jgi:hypothetical protein
MPRPKSQEKSKGERLKALPWATLARGGFVVGRRWRTLSEKERSRLAELVRESRGRPSNLGAKQRRELRGLVDKLDPKRLGRELLPLIGKSRGGRRSRRRKSA